jgi:uncharacterized membrane protein YcaP (DUF421 family)
MIELSLPWWELVLRALIVYVALLTLLRLSGKRTLGEFSTFDFLVIVLLAEAVQGAMLGGDESLLGGLIVAATVVALNYALGFISTRSKRIDKLIEGEPVVIISDGRLLDRQLKRNNLPVGDVDEAMRGENIGDIAEVRLAVLEPSGKISFIKRGGA